MSSRSTRPSTSASPTLFHLLRNIGRTLDMNRRWLSQHLGRASHHCGTVKGATRRKNGRDPQEGQDAVTNRGEAMNSQPVSV